jgi:uridine kinase
MPNVRPLVIGFAGGSGCGKTHLSHEIRDAAGEEHVSILSMDQYFTDIDLEVTTPTWSTSTTQPISTSRR